MLPSVGQARQVLFGVSTSMSVYSKVLSFVSIKNERLMEHAVKAHKVASHGGVAHAGR